ncbi:MAG: hypothetical protein ACFUZC_16150 [Chthoniobacteraceae bacterium]
MVNQRTLETKAAHALVGAIAGMVATGPMTVAMILLHRRLPQQERYPLPPREITEKLAEATGTRDHVREPLATAVTLAAHFGYGAATGTVFGLVPKPAGPSALEGAGFGLLVWVASYLGLLPATGLLPSATEHPARRNLLMIGAHLLWGAALGWLAQLLLQETKPQSTALGAPGKPTPR